MCPVRKQEHFRVTKFLFPVAIRLSISSIQYNNGRVSVRRSLRRSIRDKETCRSFREQPLGEDVDGFHGQDRGSFDNDPVIFPIRD